MKEKIPKVLKQLFGTDKHGLYFPAVQCEEVVVHPVFNFLEAADYGVVGAVLRYSWVSSV